MKTSLSFSDLAPSRFLVRRFAPLVPVVVDPEVDAFVSECGVSFIEIATALGADLDKPLRVVGPDMSQVDTAEVEEMLKNDASGFSDMFLAEEFEETGRVDKSGCRFPWLVPDEMKYDWKGEVQMPWIRAVGVRLLETLKFAEFDFSDFPSCVFYVTTPGANLKSPKDIIDSLTIPRWMQEFKDDIRIVCIIVKDGLAEDDSKEMKFMKGYAKTTTITLRNVKDGEKGIDRVRLKEKLGLDESLMSDPGFGNGLGVDDLTTLSKTMTILRDRWMKHVIEERIQRLTADITRVSGLKYRLMRSGRDVERTIYKKVSVQKIYYLRRAAAAASLGNFDEARHDFKKAGKLMDARELGSAKSWSLFCCALCSLGIAKPYPPGVLMEFTNTILDILKISEYSACKRTALAIPFIAMEIQMENKDRVGCEKVCRNLLLKMATVWTANTRVMMTAFAYERLATTMTYRRCAVLHFARAGLAYESAKLHGHCLRLLVWLSQTLSIEGWNIIRHMVWIEKVQILQTIHQESRSLVGAKELFTLPDLARSLHERALSVLWVPFNAKKASTDKQMPEFLKITRVAVHDASQPNYYGFAKREFEILEKGYAKWYSRIAGMAESRSLGEMWTRGDDDIESSEYVREVACDSVVKVIVSVFNRFAFPVHLNNVSLRVSHDNTNGAEHEVENLDRVLVPCCSRKSFCLRFNVTPKCSGNFKVEELVKQYWEHDSNPIACDPTAFLVRKKIPRLTMVICDVPETILRDTCLPFSVKVENVGTIPASVVRIACVHPDCLIYEGGCEVHRTHNTLILTFLEPITAGETVIVPLIFRVPSYLWVTLRILLDVNNRRVAYARRRINVISSMARTVYVLPRTNNSRDKIMTCQIEALVDDIRIHGVLNDEGRMLRMLHSYKDTILKTGDIVSVVCFLSDTLENDTEDWRTDNVQGFDLLYQMKDNKLLSQRNIAPKEPVSDIGLVFSVPRSITGKVGDIARCEVTVDRRSVNNNCIYVRPNPISFPDKRKFPINGCRFVGKTIACLSSDNSFTASFTFVILKSGLYGITGFRVSYTADFSDHTTVALTQYFCVTVE